MTRTNPLIPRTLVLGASIVLTSAPVALVFRSRRVRQHLTRLLVFGNAGQVD